MTLSVLIPVFNEKKTISRIIDRVLKEKTPKEIIIVDDGSIDGTREILKKINNNKIRVFYHQVNLGKGAAIRTGISQAKGDVLVIQDADLEYDPSYYKKLFVPIDEGKTKVVYGSRLKEMKLRFFGDNKTPLPFHYLANRFLSLLTNILYGSHLTDMETCYKMIARGVYSELNLKANRFEIEPEITINILKKGYQITEIPISTNPRGYREGKKIKLKDFFQALWFLLKNRF